MLARNCCLFMKVPSESVYANDGESSPSTACESLCLSASFHEFSSASTRLLSDSALFQSAAAASSAVSAQMNTTARTALLAFTYFPLDCEWKARHSLTHRLPDFQHRP